MSGKTYEEVDAIVMEMLRHPMVNGGIVALGDKRYLLHSLIDMLHQDHIRLRRTNKALRGSLLTTNASLKICLAAIYAAMDIGGPAAEVLVDTIEQLTNQRETTH